MTLAIGANRFSVMSHPLSPARRGWLDRPCCLILATVAATLITVGLSLPHLVNDKDCSLEFWMAEEYARCGTTRFCAVF